VEPAPGASVTGDELASHCRAQLAAYKVPEEWHLVDEMPRNAMGKILKPDLRARL